MQPYWEGAGITLYHGDAIEVLATFKNQSFDHMLTDPPYDQHTSDSAVTNKGGKATKAIDFDGLTPEQLEQVSWEGSRLARRWCIAFCALEQIGAYRAAAAEDWVRAGVWDRVNSMPQLSGDRPAQGAEGIAIWHGPGRKRWNGGGKQAIWRHPPHKIGRPDHPTPKPPQLMVELVQQFTDPGDLILDPFAGSGTTMVAAYRLGRQAVGVELDERYAEVAARRLEAEMAQGRLFPPPIKMLPAGDLFATSPAGGITHGEGEEGKDPEAAA